MRVTAKLIILLTSAITLSFVFISQLHSMQPQNEMQTYKFDPDHTSVLWRVKHFGFSEISGKCMAEGTLEVNTAHPEKSKLNVVIHTGEMVTAIPKLDDVLKGSNFFATDKYPNATFVSTSVKKTSKTSGTVTGILTIKNIQKPVTLTVKLNQNSIHPFFHKQALGFSAQATINRSDFDMSGYVPDVSDQVNLDIQAEAELIQP